MANKDIEIARPIRCILSDVDGVLTDGSIVWDNQGVETKMFFVRDGLGIKLWQRCGFTFGLVTARNSQIVKTRAAELGIEVVRQGFAEKLPAARDVMQQLGLTPEEVCYIGDDLPDLPVMYEVGLAVAVADASTEVRDAAKWVMTARGGRGAVRELVERLLKAKGRWEDCLPHQTHPLMQSYVKQYLISLGIVLIAMLLYRGTVVPLIEPAHREKPQPIVYNPDLHTTQWWQRHFPTDSWQQGQPKVLQTPRGILLFKKFTQLGPDQWRLEPLTMIIPHSQKKRDMHSDDQSFADQDVLIVNADLGAMIQFREAFDLMKGKAPPVIGGKLEGQINITRKAKVATDERPWSLTTSDVQIDRRKISTIKPVEIRWDNSVIRGRDLSIFLKQDLLSDTDNDPSPWGILENMELIYIDEISVGLPPGGLWADMKQASPELPVTRGLPAQLRVQSGGPFRFDFVASQASLMNGVLAIHQVGSLPPDQFESQEVQVTLAPTAPNTAPKSPQTTVSMGAVQFKQLTARGMDPVGPLKGKNIVRFDAPNIGASAPRKTTEHQLRRQSTRTRRSARRSPSGQYGCDA